jgi:hypothetical protein
VDGPSSKLGARFRRALETDEERKTREREVAERAREDGRRAREALFEQLHGLAREIGLGFEASPSGITFKHAGRYLHFGRDGDGERVKLSWDGLAPEEATLGRQPELADRWILTRKRGAREVRLPLFDQGLEELLVRVLGLPKPSE